MHRQVAIAQCIMSTRAVRRGLGEVATQGDKHFGAFGLHRLNRQHGVVAMQARDLKLETLLQCIQQPLGWLLVDTHGAVTLHVTVTPYRRQSGPRLADVAAQQLQVDDFLHCRHRVTVLGNAHGPAHDHPLGSPVHACGQLQLSQTQARLFNDVRPGGGINLRQVGVQARGMLGNKGMIENRWLALGLGFALPSKQELGNAAHYRHIAAQGRPEIRSIGRFGTIAEHLERMLWMLEAFQTALLERVEAHHLGATLDRFTQGFKHARVVGAGVLADDENCVSLLQVMKDHRAFAYAQGFAHPYPAGLMAHVRTVGKVVGTKCAYKQLIKIRRLIAGPPGGVELGLVGRVQPVEVTCNQGKRLVPRSFNVMIGGSVIAHRMGQTPLIFEPVIGLIGQCADAVTGEERRVDRTPRGLPVDRLGTVFTELDHAIFRGLTPGTPRAIEAAILVGLEHRPQVFEGIFTAQPALGHAFQRPPSSGRGIIVFDVFVLTHHGIPRCARRDLLISRQAQAMLRHG
ncbi:hypothetical protein D3C77_144050 [compost metagenome]